LLDNFTILSRENDEKTKEEILIEFNQLDKVITIFLIRCFTEEEWTFGSYEFSNAKARSILNGGVKS
jgi:hypothetical protein